MAKKTPKPTANKKTSTIPAWQKLFLLLLVLVFVGNGAAGYWAYNQWVLNAEQERLLALSTEYGQQQAKVVTDYFDSLRKKIRLLASSGNLTTALKENNAAVVERFQNDMRNSITASTWVNIYLPKTAQLTTDAEQPIRFAELDMINRAEKREQVSPEASQVNGAWRIAIVEPLPVVDGAAEEAAVDGVLFMFITADDLFAALRQSNASAGSTVLLQQFGNGQPQTIIQLGQDGIGAGGEVSVAQSHLRIRFMPSFSLAQQAAVSPILLFVVLFALFAVSVALAWFLAKFLGEKLGRASAVVVSAAETKATVGSTYADPMFQNKDMLKVEVREEDSRLLGLDKKLKHQDPLDIQDKPAAKASAPADAAPAHIFRAYDIRGIAGTELNSQLAIAIGQGVGSIALEAGDNSIYVARDGRTHSPEYTELLIEGILSTGCNVINLGTVPTPLMNFAICEDKQSSSGVMVTASHNPANYNGFKIVINGKPLFDEGIQALRARIAQGNFLAKGTARESSHDVVEQYIDRIFSDIALAGELTVVVDAGNGVTGKVAPRLLEELGCRVIPLFCDIDGTFPNHNPDPSVDTNLKTLIARVKSEGADIGIALDGDGDRLGVVTASGDIVRADRLLMLLAKDIVSRNPGSDVVFDVKSSRELNNVVTTYGGRPIMWKSGHSPMKAKMLETKAVVGGELSGHIFIAERWYGFDDGLYAATRILEIMSLRDQSLEEVLAGLPNPPSTGEILIPIDEGKKFNFIRALIEQADFGDARINTIDGLRVEFEKGWGLVRASNTSASLTLRFEADTTDILHDIQQQFKYQMLKVDSELIVAFD